MKNKPLIILLAVSFNGFANSDYFWSDIYNEPTLLTLKIDKNPKLLGFLFKIEKVT